VFLPLVAIGSYGLIERPCIRLGRRLEQALQNRNARLGEEAETAKPATP
jgi:peptidoglycan/LPS O-acetylase OafA/YrhL